MPPTTDDDVGDPTVMTATTMDTEEQEDDGMKLHPSGSEEEQLGQFNEVSGASRSTMTLFQKAAKAVAAEAEDEGGLVDTSGISNKTAMEEDLEAVLVQGSNVGGGGDSTMKEVTEDAPAVSRPSLAGVTTQAGASEWQLLDQHEEEMTTDGMSVEEFSFGSSNDSISDEPQSQSPDTAMEKPFDMDLLRDTIEMGELALDGVRGKDVVLVVGKTGVGKSTLIHGIAGRSFKQTSYTTEMFSQTIESQVFDAEDPVPGFEIGHAKESKTRALNVFSRQDVAAENSVVYVDTPGFEDTEGAEVDVATSVMLTQVAKKCRSMRFVVMINYVSLLEERGGALRSVLKFVRKFVTDFKEAQQSFVFLFTHTNQIKSVPDSVEGAKKELEKEVIKIIGGTNDEGVLDVLRFLRKSLGKNYPFVDVIHPLQTDFAALSFFIESRNVKRLENPKIAASCGLTNTAQMKLSAEVQRLLHETKHLIKRDDTDVPRLFEIQSYFQYFSKYLAFGDVLKAVQDNDDVMREYVESLHAAVDEEILYGTDSTDRVANIDRLNKSIRALSALDGKFSIQFATNRIVHKVTTFQKNILIDMEQDFVGLGIRLSKLKIWCEFVPPELNFLYDDLVSNLSRLVQKSVDAIASFSLTELERIEVTGFVTLVSHLSRLKQLMDERTKGRSIRELNIHVVSRALFGALGRISRSLETWGADCDSTLRTLDFNDESVVNTLKARAETLEIMAEVMRHASLHFKISETVGLLSLTILVETTQKFDAVCTDLEWNQSKFDSSWKSRMLTLRDASYAFGKLQDNGWSQMSASFVSLVETITGLIKKKSGELHEMAQDAYDHGLRDGKRNAGALSAFEALTWFDQLLLPENRFVENTAFAARRMYDDKVQS